MRTPRLLALTAAASTLLLALSACSAPAASAPVASDDAVTLVPAEGITVGDGPVLVELWTDPSCPHCAALEAGTGEDLAAAVAGGDITLTIHPMNYVSAKRGDTTDYSTRAGNLLALVADAEEYDAVLPLYALLQANQVDENGAPSDDELLAFAAEAGVAADLSAGVTGRTMAGWVQQANDAWQGRALANGATVNGVPLLVIADEKFEVREDGTDPARFREALETAAG